QQHSCNCRTVHSLDEFKRAMLFQTADGAPPHLLGQTIHDLDAGEIALVHRAIEALPGKSLLMDRAVWVAIEEAAELVLELAHSFKGARHERPGELLVGQPCATLDRVHEMALNGVARCKRDVVPTLHHARAAALAKESLHGDGDAERRVSSLRMQGREQT